MPETLPNTPPPPPATPHDRVAAYGPLLTENGWTIQIEHTAERARLDAEHPSGAAVMVTAGVAGRSGHDGRIRRYALHPGNVSPQPWLSVRGAWFEKFVRTRKTQGRRVLSKCRCKTGDGHPKHRHPTERRATDVLLTARIRRAVSGQARRAECRVYRCPDDDRVWHLSSLPTWTPAPGDSVLWTTTPEQGAA